jgi:microtubule-associated protein-like 6
MEIDTQTKAITVIMQGHGGMQEPKNAYAGELWGLDVHPDNQHYATAGEDRTIRIYNIQGHRCVGMYNELPFRSRACSWHPDGRQLAVAFKTGQILILEWDQAAGTLTPLANQPQQKRDFTKLAQWPETGGIDELRFSPDGTMLATGSHSEGKGGSGGRLDIYQTDTWTRIAECKGHTSFVRHLDWTEDSNYLHSTDANPELLFWEARKGNLLRGGASALADANWATFSTEVGWPVQGIYRKLPGFKKQMDGSDVNMCDVNPDKDLLVVGDDFGNVTLYNYPCTNKKDECHYCEGHSSFVMNVKFSKDGNYVFSTGGHDLSIMQWRVTK